MIKTDPNVKMDQCHLDLLYGLIVSHKPQKILELGMGSAVATSVILKAIRYNGMAAELTCVDNWMDWNFKKPEEITSYEAKGVRVVTSGEKEFIFSCKEKYDLILSDADHDHAQDWFDRTAGLLEQGGILIYHDVMNPQFANLYEIVRKTIKSGHSYILFERSSRADENCGRGLLVITTEKRYRLPLAVTIMHRFKQVFRWVKRLRNHGK